MDGKDITKSGNWRKACPYEDFKVGQEVRLAANPEIIGTVTEVRSYCGEIKVRIWVSEREYHIEHFLFDQVLIKEVADTETEKYDQYHAWFFENY